MVVKGHLANAGHESIDKSHASPAKWVIVKARTVIPFDSKHEAPGWEWE
jgi:hypothetical protein